MIKRQKKPKGIIPREKKGSFPGKKKKGGQSLWNSYATLWKISVYFPLGECDFQNGLLVEQLHLRFTLPLCNILVTSTTEGVHILIWSVQCGNPKEFKRWNQVSFLPQSLYAMTDGCHFDSYTWTMNNCTSRFFWCKKKQISITMYNINARVM